MDLLYKLEEYTLQYVLAWICCRQAATHAPVLKPAVCLHNVAAVAAGAGATVSEAPGAFQPGAASGRQHGICMQIDNDHLPRQAWDTHIHLQMGKSLTQTAAAVSLFCTMTCRGHRLPSKPSVASAVATGLRRRGCHTCHPGISIGASRRKRTGLSLAPPFSVRKNRSFAETGSGLSNMRRS